MKRGRRQAASASQLSVGSRSRRPSAPSSLSCTPSRRCTPPSSALRERARLRAITGGGNDPIGRHQHHSASIQHVSICCSGQSTPICPLHAPRTIVVCADDNLYLFPLSNMWAPLIYQRVDQFLTVLNIG
jgi:hypothetical protein